MIWLVLLGACDPIRWLQAEPSAEVPTVIELTWKDGGSGGPATVTYGVDDPEAFVLGPREPVDGRYTFHLTGLPEDAVVQVHIEVEDGLETVTEDLEATTGRLRSDLPDFTLQAGEPVDGFTLVMLTDNGPGSVTGALILDGAGRKVWFHGRSDRPAPEPRAWLAPDGSGVLYVTGGLVQHVAWNGEVLEEQVIDDGQRDFLVLDDGTILAIQPDVRTVGSTPVEGNRVRAFHPDGTVETVWDTWDVYPEPEPGPVDPDLGAWDWVHANALGYDPERNRLYVGMRYGDGVAAVDLSNRAHLWTMGGAYDDLDTKYSSAREGLPNFSPHSAWPVPGGLLIFDNSYDACSQAVRFEVDEQAMAAEAWSYHGDACTLVTHFGHAWPLEDGQVLVTWSEEPALEQVTEEGEVTWRVGPPEGSAYLGYGVRVAALGG